MRSLHRAYGPLGIALILGHVLLIVAALRFLAGREYAAGGLCVFGAAAMGHLGLELVALAEAARTRSGNAA